MNFRHFVFTAAIGCSVLLAACGSDSSKQASADATTSTTAQKASLTCGDAPVSLVNSVLGTNVSQPAVTARPGGGIRCSYNSQEVIIGMYNDATPEFYKTQVSAVDGATPINGLGDEAASYSAKAEDGATVVAVFARRGNRMITVTAASGVDKETELVRQLLTK